MKYVWGVRPASPPHRIVLLGFSSPTGSKFEFDELLKQIQQKPTDIDLRSETQRVHGDKATGGREVERKRRQADRETEEAQRERGQGERETKRGTGIERHSINRGNTTVGETD